MKLRALSNSIYKVWTIKFFDCLEDGDSTFIRDIGNKLPINTGTYHREWRCDNPSVTQDLRQWTRWRQFRRRQCCPVHVRPQEGPIFVEKCKTTYVVSADKIQRPEKREALGCSGLYCQIYRLFSMLKKIKACRRFGRCGAKQKKVATRIDRRENLKHKMTIFFFVWRLWTRWQGNGESCITRSWMICTPYPILCGW